MNKYNNGPYGQYTQPCVERIQNLLVLHEGLSKQLVDTFVIYDEFVYFNNNPIAEYRWFDNNMAYFRWIRKLEDTNKYDIHWEGAKCIKKPNFRVVLGCHNQPVLEFHKQFATPHLHSYIGLMLTNWMDLKAYDLHKDCGAFFQSGSHDENSDYFMIEFWQPKGIQAFVDHFNENYDPDLDFDTLITNYCKNNKV